LLFQLPFHSWSPESPLNYDSLVSLHVIRSLQSFLLAAYLRAKRFGLQVDEQFEAGTIVVVPNWQPNATHAVLGLAAGNAAFQVGQNGGILQRLC
jgi:hypothetical protein